MKFVKEKAISPLAKEDFLRNLEMPIKDGKFSIHSIVEGKEIRLNNLCVQTYKSVITEGGNDELIRLVNTLTDGVLYARYVLKNKPKKYHSLIR